MWRWKIIFITPSGSGYELVYPLKFDSFTEAKFSALNQLEAGIVDLNRPEKDAVMLELVFYVEGGNGR